MHILGILRNYKTAEWIGLGVRLHFHQNLIGVPDAFAILRNNGAMLGPLLTLPVPLDGILIEIVAIIQSMV